MPWARPVQSNKAAKSTRAPTSPARASDASTFPCTIDECARSCRARTSPELLVRTSEETGTGSTPWLSFRCHERKVGSGPVHRPSNGKAFAVIAAMAYPEITVETRFRRLSPTRLGGPHRPQTSNGIRLGERIPEFVEVGLCSARLPAAKTSSVQKTPPTSNDASMAGACHPSDRAEPPACARRAARQAWT